MNLYLYVPAYFLLVVIKPLPADGRFVQQVWGLSPSAFPGGAQARKRTISCASLKSLSFCRSWWYQRKFAVYHAKALPVLFSAAAKS